jgi:hypothetical protein
MAGLLGLDGSPAASQINPKEARPRPGRLLRSLRGNRGPPYMASQWLAGLAAGIPFSTQAKAPIVTLLGWSPGESPLRIAEVVPAVLAYLGLSQKT